MEEKDGITLGDLVNAVWKNVILVGIITLVTTIIGIAFTFGVVKEKYTSTSTVVVAINVNTSYGDNYDYVNSLRIVSTVGELVKQDIVLDKAADACDVSTGTLRGMVSVSYSEKSLLVNISVTSTDNTKTKEYANAITDALIEVSNSENYKFINGAISQTTPAKDGAYTSPNKKLYIIVSFILGGILSCVVVFVKEFMSSKFKNKKDVENLLDEEIISVFDDNKEFKNNNSYSLVEANISNYEAYNRLLNNIKYSNLENPYKVVMITSTVSDELKSTTLANLATCMVNNGKRVAIIDLDTRKPVIHKFFKVSKEAGLVEYIEGSISKEELIKKTDSGVDVITAGKKIINPAVIIDSKALATLIKELKEEYDYVLVDTPPVLICSEAQTISKLCDGVIYNVAMNQTKKNDVKEAIKTLKFANAKVIGVNLTKYPSKNKSDYYYYSKENCK